MKSFSSVVPQRDCEKVLGIFLSCRLEQFVFWFGIIGLYYCSFGMCFFFFFFFPQNVKFIVKIFAFCCKHKVGFFLLLHLVCSLMVMWMHLHKNKGFLIFLFIKFKRRYLLLSFRNINLFDRANEFRFNPQLNNRKTLWVINNVLLGLTFFLSVECSVYYCTHWNNEICYVIRI